MYFAENSSISAYACTNRVNFSSSDKANGSSSSKLVDPNNVVSFKKGMAIINFLWPNRGMNCGEVKKLEFS